MTAKTSFRFLSASLLVLAAVAARADLNIRPSGDNGVRITLSTNEARLPLNPALVDQKWPAPALSVKPGEARSKVRVGNMLVSVTAKPVVVRVEALDGRLVQEVTFDESTGGLTFPVGDAPVLGLGEGADQFDRRGANYRLINGQRDRLAELGTRVFSPFLIGTKGWALLIGTPFGPIDLRTETGVFTPTSNAVPGHLDLWVIDAKEPVNAMKEYIRLTGAPAMPPKWALGYMQSHRTLSNETDILMEAKLFRDRKLPLDTFIFLGTDFCTNGWNFSHDSFDFNTRVFTRKAPEVLKDLHDLNLRVAVHIVPQTSAATGSRVIYRSLHGNIPPLPGEDVTNVMHIANYWERHMDLVRAGMDAWWPDEGDWLDVPSRLARYRLYYQGPLSAKPNVRPWNLQRNGYMGISKYSGWYWSGDIQSKWATLAQQVKVGLNSSMSVSPYWGTDTGGFYQAPSREYTGELYVRWFQFSAFCPSFRSHGRVWRLHSPWGWALTEPGPTEGQRLPDAAELGNTAVEPICREYLNLRYQLMPYTYTLAREARDTGMPLMRAMWLHHPDDAEAVKRGDQYLWGKDMLVVPVVEKGATEREVYLPRGTTWYDWWSNEKAEGGRTLTRKVDLKTMPIYVRAGAIIPFDPVRQYVEQPVTDPTTIRVYAGANGKFSMYEDDGISQEYLSGAGSWTEFVWDDAGKKLSISGKGQTGRLTSPRDSGTTGTPTSARREFDVLLLPDNVRKSVTFSGAPATVNF